ncbi:Gfo/Idh/MocA family oxidoreductase [Chromohalobacter canadensis]|uniref:Gfo/Idh/MocA family oxidoreductase n=1 Tax=Chromohalobacter canadensis TaxID=141389 RepID=UPI00240F2431|nr:Gfo/Idh/MocA family oxidoreductase [Chromohalobacter canadensis]
MRILIVGLGYAGKRFLSAFYEINRERARNSQSMINLAYINRSPIEVGIPSYTDIASALSQFMPDIVVVAVTDGEHFNILQKLNGYRGFIICEKPLVNRCDNLPLVESCMQNTAGFAMDMVERYSAVTSTLKDYVRQHGLMLSRAHFIWGKDRINDHRRTSGAVSEIVHPLDLIEHVIGDTAPLEYHSAIGTYSDFSVSGSSILDSLYVGARLNKAIVTGYSSFVNIERQRTVDFIFTKPDGFSVYAHAVYDTPTWDSDLLTIWDPDRPDKTPLRELVTDNGTAGMGALTIAKLTQLSRAAVDYTEGRIQPDTPFCDLDNSLRLQKLLNLVELNAKAVGPYRIRGSRRPADPATLTDEILG